LMVQIEELHSEDEPQDEASRNESTTTQLRDQGTMLPPSSQLYQQMRSLIQTHLCDDRAIECLIDGVRQLRLEEYSEESSKRHAKIKIFASHHRINMQLVTNLLQLLSVTDTTQAAAASISGTPSPPKAAPRTVLLAPPPLSAPLQPPAASPHATDGNSCRRRSQASEASRDSSASPHRGRGCRHRSRSRAHRGHDRSRGNESLDRLSRKMTRVLRYEVAGLGHSVATDGFVLLAQLLQMGALRHYNEQQVLEVVRTSTRSDGSPHFERRAGQGGEVLIKSVPNPRRPFGGRSHHSHSPGARQRRLSKACSRILRHRQPAPNDLILQDGFTPVSHLMELLRRGKFSPTFEELRQIVHSSIHDDGQPRFEMRTRGDQTWWIRATSGHSIPGMNSQLN